MTFNIIELQEGELENFTTIQMQLLRTAQKKKNELEHKLQSEIELFKKLILGNGMKNSSLYGHKMQELQAEFEYQVEILREQLEYSLTVNEPYLNPADVDTEMVGYIVDYTLSYTDRYAIVREYYLSIDDPALRMRLYTDDDVAKKYLGSYYSVLYNVLYNYSR